MAKWNKKKGDEPVSPPVAPPSEEPKAEIDVPVEKKLEAPADCLHPDDCKAPECDCEPPPPAVAAKVEVPVEKVGSLKERRAFRQAQEKTREAAHSSVQENKSCTAKAKNL